MVQVTININSTIDTIDSIKFGHFIEVKASKAKD